MHAEKKGTLRSTCAKKLSGRANGKDAMRRCSGWFFEIPRENIAMVSWKKDHSTQQYNKVETGATQM